MASLWTVSCAPAPPEDGRPGQVAADPTRRFPRPDVAVASFHFPGNEPNQREFVWLYPGDSYDYAERWDVGVPEDAAFELELGWDWKIGCRLEVRMLDGDTPCCTQTCAGGGDSGVGHEPPAAFSCMNRSAGGRYDWFLEGLSANGLGGLDACLPPTSGRRERGGDAASRP